VADIVVVEDNEQLRQLTVRVLQRAGHTVVAAADGAAGLEAVRDHTPDLVVSDIDMPVMSGVEMCRALRADDRTAHLPVLFVSGSLVPGDTRATDAGVSALMHKPFRPAGLLACVEQLLRTGHAPEAEPRLYP
jgi:CheY-like chemotaxis protein